MPERRWISREEIAEIHEARALKEVHEPEGDTWKAISIHKQAIGIREIESIYSPNLDSHIHNTQLANKTGHYTR